MTNCGSKFHLGVGDKFRRGATRFDDPGHDRAFSF